MNYATQLRKENFFVDVFEMKAFAKKDFDAIRGIVL